MLTRIQVLNLLEQEREYILSQARLPTSDPPKWSIPDLRWYLKMAENWALVALWELARNQSPGRLLDIGAFYCLASGAACRIGWKAVGVDYAPIPSYSGLASRGAETALCNISVDALPFDSSSFDAIFFLEVLEHLPYSPAHPFREMHRVLKPGGRLYLTTPNAASLSRVRLLLLGKNHEPSVDAFVDEDDPFSYKGMTFFKSQREARLWTVEELRALLPVWGFRLADYYFYSSVVYDPDFPSRVRRLSMAAKFWMHPLLCRIRLLGGGGMFVVAERPL